MKKENILHSLICLLAVSCTVQEIDTQSPLSPVKENPTEQEVFYASLESYSTPETKVYVDEDIDLHWDADDKLSIFNKNTLNHPYQFSGETGDVSGYFTSVSNPAGEGNDLDFIYSVYPYQESTTISDEGVISLSLPAVQTYKAGSFGIDANTMVSRTDGNFLKFKNACGYLVLKLYGTGVSVSSIRLDGLHEEKLSGEATVTYTTEGNPEIAMTSNAGTSITLNCENPVELGSTPTVFWMVVPPTSFTQGFTLTVTDPNGYVFFKETARTDLSIDRNSVLRISPIEVSFNSSGISLNNNDIVPVNSANQTIKSESSVDEATRTVTVTMPTVTNFKNLIFSYNIGSKTVYVDGKKIVNGETSIDASKDVTLTIRNGQYGKNYILKAQNTGLPVVRITTDGVKVSRAIIEGDEVHQTVWRPEVDDNNVFVPGTGSASVRIELPDGTVDCETNTQIKGRGNATWGYPKKPYALKFLKKYKVLGMKKSKRWILLANWKDRTLLRNDAAFWLSKKSGLPFTVSGYFVELEFDGEYRGNYYLCEQIKIDENRVSITEMAKNETDPWKITGGYLMEIDNNFDEKYTFRSGFYGNSYSGGLKYMFNDPDDDLSNAAVAYMTNYIQNMETLIKKIPNGNYGYRNFLDMDSAIWFMFVNELTGNGDFFNTDGNVGSTYYGPHSTFLYKDRDNEDGTVSKLFMGPVWDFDYLTFYDKSGNPSRSNKWVGVTQSNYYFYWLTQDPLFRSRTLELWRRYKPIIETGMLNYIEEMKEHIRLSESFNAEFWKYNGQDQHQNGDNTDSFDVAVEKMDSAFVRKLRFMDKKIEAGNFTNSN